MSKNIKYKVTSSSSHEKEYPSTALQSHHHKSGWQTKRFCTYPQEITLEFDKVMEIGKIEILMDRTKTASSVDILYFDPLMTLESTKFSKYGSLDFSQNKNTSDHEKKKVELRLRCLFIRFLFYAPHKVKENMFSQVHIHEICLFGNEAKIEENVSIIDANYNTIEEQDDDFVYNKLVELQTRKQNAAAKEDFEEADRIKEIMENLNKFGQRLKGLEGKKNWAARQENYELAHSIKKDMERLKGEVEFLINEALFVEEDQVGGLEEEIILKGKFKQTDFQTKTESESQIFKSNSSKNKSYATNTNVLDFDEQVLPALQNKNKNEKTINSESSEFG